MYMDKKRLVKMDRHTDNRPSVHFKSASVSTLAIKRLSMINRPIWKTRRSLSKQLSLDQTIPEELTPLVTLAVEGKTEELKCAIQEHKVSLRAVDKYGRTLLHIAALYNQEQVMSFLIDSGCLLDDVDYDGNTALHLAAMNDHPESCHILLSNGADDSILNQDMYAPIHIAAQGSNKVLQAILEHPIDTSIVGHHSKTLLHFICENDNIEGLAIYTNKVLANVTKTSNNLTSLDDERLTPIHLATFKNSYRVLDFLIKECAMFGYAVDTLLEYLDEEKNTLLQIAVDNCNIESVEVLLKHGASPVISKGNLSPPLHLACSQGRSDVVKLMVQYAGPHIILSIDQLQKTPLHHCALSVHSSCMIPLLMETGKGFIQIDPPDAKGRTPLHNAVTSANLAGIKQLLTYGANPLAKDQKGMNALHLAIDANKKAIVNALLELPCIADLINQTCLKGYSAIHHALYTNNGDFVPRMIAALNFKVEKIHDEDGNNYLHLAAEKGDHKALQALLDVPDIHKLLNEPNSYGMTPLHSAASEGHYRSINILLSNGAIFHKALNGETAFLIACKKGFKNCAKILYLSHPFQINMTDDDGNTALHASAHSRNPTMIGFLLDRKCKLSINSDSLTFLDTLIDIGELDCVMVVINHDRWEECLDFCSVKYPNPIIRLVEQMPRAAKAVLDRCHLKSSLDKSHSDHWESFDFKYLYCKENTTHEGSVVRKPSAVHPQNENAHFQGTSHQERSAVKVSYGKQTMTVLQKMQQFKRQDLLTHAVVNSYFERKWSRYGNAVYFGWYILKLLIALFLFVFVLIVPNPVKVLSSLNQTELAMQRDELLTLETAPQVIRAVTLLLNFLYTGGIIFNIVVYAKRKGSNNIFLQASVWGGVIACTFLYIFLLFPNPLYAWPVGAVCCFLWWFSLVLGLEHFPLAGTIVKMILEVTKTVVLVLFVTSFLLLAFAFSFYILAGNLSEFSHVGYAFLSVFSFMLGELPYDMYVSQDATGSLSFGGLVLVFLLLLAILMSIALANLLIGLAVGDIERVKFNAILQRKDIEIEFFSQLDASIPKGTLIRFSQPSHTLYPNKNRSIWSIWRDSWKWIEAQIEPEETDQSTSSIASDIAEMKEHIIELKGAVQQMQEANDDFRRRYRGLSARSSIASFDFDPDIKFD